MEERTFYFYIMASRTRVLYCGVCSRIRRRVWQHKTKHFEGFTSQYNINRLVYYEVFQDIRNAIDREKQVKRVVSCQEAGDNRCDEPDVAGFERELV